MTKEEQINRLKHISFFDKLGYGAGNLGFGIIYQVISSYLVFYATAVLGAPGSLVGIAISISVIWDGVTDPIMGYISDITYSKKWGRRHLYILLGSVSIAVFNYLLWIVTPDMTTFAKFLWILIDVLLVKTFMTIYVTPYTALGAELSSDYNERTSIQGIKTVFFLIGIFFGSVMGMLLFFEPTQKFPIGQLNPAAYRNMGLTSSVIMLVFGLGCFLTTKKYIPYLANNVNLNKAGNNTGKQGREDLLKLLRNFISALNNRYFKYIVFGYLFTNISSAFVSTLGMHVFTYTFRMDNNGIALMFGTLFATSILSQPVWVWISKKIDKKPSIMLGLFISIFGSAVFVIMVFIKDMISGNPWYMVPFAVLVGFGTGGLFSIPPSMVADTIDVEELNTGIRSEGVYYGCLTLGYKLSQSIAIFMLGILLDILKFNPDLPVQPESTVFTLGLVLPFGSIIAFGLAVFSYWRYDLDRYTIQDIQKRIAMQNKLM